MWPGWSRTSDPWIRSQTRSRRQATPPHDKANKMTIAPSEDADQPVYPPSLIRVFAVRMKKH